MMDIANEFPAGENGGYCIEPFGAFNLLNMGGFGTKPQWMLGPKRIWFYPC